MGNSLNSHASKLNYPADLEKVPPLWIAPSTTSNEHFLLRRYDKEYISTSLSASIQGRSLSIDTRQHKLVLKADGKTLAVAKKGGTIFTVMTMQPLFPGQLSCGKLQRENNAPLYFHTRVQRYGTKKYAVYQVNEKVLEITKGPNKNAFEKYCRFVDSDEDWAFWHYTPPHNRVDVFQSNGQSPVDIGLLMLLVVMCDIFRTDENMDKSGAAAA